MKVLSQMLAFGYCPDRYAPIVTTSQIGSFEGIAFIKQKIIEMEVHHTSLLDAFCNMYRDFPGRFFDPEVGFVNPLSGRFQEVFVNTEPLIEAPIEWWRDNFSPAYAERPILKLRSEARPRWQALGSIYFAYHPWERLVWQLEVANDNRPPHSG